MSEHLHESTTRGGVDLLTGVPWKKILVFSVPLIIGNMFQQLYVTIDSVIVGRVVGSLGLAAVGVSTSMQFLIISIFMGVATGASILVSQYYGAKDTVSLRRTLHTSILLALIVGIVLSVLGVIFSPAILRLLNTPEDITPMALTYMRILLAGMIGQMMYNMMSGFMRGLGNSRIPLIILIISSITSTVLELLFVIPMKMGVAGAALSTILAQLLSAVLSIIALHRFSELTRISLHELKISWQSAMEILALGVPTAIQQGVISVGGMIIQGFVNSYGTYVIAGYSAATKVDMFAVMPIMSLSLAMVSYTGQNIGAGRMDRVNEGSSQGIKLTLIITLILSSILVFFGEYALLLFTDDLETVHAGLTMIRTVVPFYFLFAITQPIGGVMRGAGETVSPMINALMMNIFARIPLVIILNHFFNRVESVYWSQIFGWVFGLVHMLIVYRRGKWKQKAQDRINNLQNEEEGFTGIVSGEKLDELDMV